MERVLCLLAAVCSSYALATEFTGAGKVNDLLVRQSLNSYAVIYIEGFDKAGECHVYFGKNLVALGIPSNGKADAMYSLLLAAYMSAQTVSIRVDDTKVDNDGNCIIQDLRLNPGV